MTTVSSTAPSIKKAGLLSIFGALCLVLILFSCKKDPITEGNNPPGSGAENTSNTGWLGNENNATIPNDPLFFSGGTASSIDLSPFMPMVRSQGQTGTCVAWACGYYQRSALSAIDKNYSPSQINSTSRQFSPKDLYWALPTKGDNCDGAKFELALNTLQQRGVATLQTVPFQNLGDCSQQPLSSWTDEAAAAKISYFRDLPVTVSAMKAKLAEKRPLVFGAMVTTGFQDWKGSGVMQKNDLYGAGVGGHAMTIVGYDDAKAAFRIVNSWGADWGDEGYAWIDYDLMTDPEFIKCAFSAYLDQDTDPVNPPPSGNASDVAVNKLSDVDDPDYTNPLKRIVRYNVKNNGNQIIKSTKDWDIAYLYVNAYDVTDYQVIVHRYITDDFSGLEGEQGANPNGIGSSSNRWYNACLESDETLAEAMFDASSNSAINAYFTMPNITGYYYMVMIADPFEKLDDANLANNTWFLVGADGGPIYFSNGIGQGFSSGEAEERSADSNPHTPVNEQHPNAYRPQEIRKFLQQEYRAGRILTGTNQNTAADQLSGQ
jgi:hypothetical protein